MLSLLASTLACACLEVLAVHELFELKTFALLLLPLRLLLACALVCACLEVLEVLRLRKEVLEVLELLEFKELGVRGEPSVPVTRPTFSYQEDGQSRLSL